MLRIFSIFIAFILAVISVFHGSIYTVIILAVMAFGWCASLLANIYLRGRIRYTAKVDGGVRNGNARIRITAVNDGYLPAFFFTGILKIENTFTGEKKKKRFVLPIKARGENTLVPEIGAPTCGKYTLWIEKPSLSDMFGIVNLPIKLEEHCNYTVLPDLFDVIVDYEARESSSFDNELYSPYKKGKDRSEVFQIREYEDGDNLNSIHWKLSGKIDKVMVKDPSLPLNKELIIAADKSVDIEPSVEQCEKLAEVTLSICQSLIEAGMTYKLIWNDPADNLIYTREVQFESDFMESLNEILTGKPAVSAESLATLYEKMLGSIDTTHVIYISIGEREIPEGVFRGGLIKEIPVDLPDYRERYGVIAV